MAEGWDWVDLKGFDAEGYECREACLGIAECPRCGRDVELVGDTEEWVEGSDGRWHHSSYGPANGVCCGLLIVYSWNGIEVYKLEKKEAE